MDANYSASYYFVSMNAEKELKKAIKSGNGKRIAKAFELFYNENVRLVYRVLIDSFGKDDETDDDVQESFLGLLKEPTRLLNIDRVVDYWIQSAKYVCGHRREKQKRLDQLEEEAELSSQERGIPDLVQGKEIFGKIEAWLGHPDSDIVILKSAYDYSQKEIAERLGMGEDAVCYRYRKGIKELKRRFKNEKE